MNDNTEQTVQEYITSLNTDKQTLVNNLVTKGVSASNEETFTSLVPKVLDIDSGGGDPNKTVFMTDTTQAMNELTTMEDKDICIVYKNTLESATATSQFQTAYFPKKVVLSSAIQDMIYCQYTTVESSLYGNGQLQVSATDMRFMFSVMGEPGSEFFVDIEYTSTDGINYTRTDTNSSFVDFTTQIELENQEEWNDIFGAFLKLGEISFVGIYEYINGAWSYAPLNIPLDTQDLYPDIKAYADDGIVTGNMGQNIQNGFNFVKFNNLVANIDTSDVTSLEHAFRSCEDTTLPIVPEMDTSNVEDFQGCFLGCSNVEKLDLSTWNFSKVVGIPATGGGFSSMFQDCTNLKEILGIKDMIKSTYTDVASYLFSNCSSLTSLDLSGWDLTNCQVWYLFPGCSQLESIDTTGWNYQGKIVDTGRTSYDAYSAFSGMFQGCTNLTSLNLSGISGLFSTISNTPTGNFLNCSSLETIDLSNIQIVSNNISGEFKGCTSLKTITGIENYVHATSIAEGYSINEYPNLSEVFKDCSSLTSLDLSGWTFGEGVNWQHKSWTQINNIFDGCSSLTTLNLSSFIMNPYNTTGMFKGCTSLQHLDIRQMDLSQVGVSTDMFTGVPANCEIIVKDQPSKDFILTLRSDFTNIKLVSELSE